MTLAPEEAPANSVPAAAVIQRVQALIGITGRKAARRWFVKVGCEIPGLNLGMAPDTGRLKYGKGVWNFPVNREMPRFGEGPPGAKGQPLGPKY